MRGDRLDYAAEQIWSIPRATDGEKGGPNQSFGAGGVPLPAMASQWPTPGAAMWPTPQTDSFRSRGGERKDEKGLDRMARDWPTPMANDGCRPSAGNRRTADLTHAAGMWMTPSASDPHRGGVITENMSGTSLTQQVNGLCSRPVRATGYGVPSRLSILSAFQRYRATTCSSMRAEMRALIRMAIRAERAGQRRGFTRPSFRKSLNARFVAWLMGWPDHWTSICSVPPASMPSELSATALCLWRARMRSELSALPLPGDMVPIQPDLFGGRHD